ncbi:unnamed protein product [Tuwongella immobilis]|uniref:Uncharacterized protein n=1 Tax=Tuwongella immobilis TaxID=692036 RepID=A0A6C2YIG8_9BACT|nr:unnamed protein product [Tuwongella immobilis]VTR97284.1 unnamed protein product [Tuwongella immobilis]
MENGMESRVIIKESEENHIDLVSVQVSCNLTNSKPSTSRSNVNHCPRANRMRYWMVLVIFWLESLSDFFCSMSQSLQWNDLGTVKFETISL